MHAARRRPLRQTTKIKFAQSCEPHDAMMSSNFRNTRGFRGTGLRALPARRTCRVHAPSYRGSGKTGPHASRRDMFTLQPLRNLFPLVPKHGLLGSDIAGRMPAPMHACSTSGRGPSLLVGGAGARPAMAGRGSVILYLCAAAGALPHPCATPACHSWAPQCAEGAPRHAKMWAMLVLQQRRRWQYCGDGARGRGALAT